MSAPCKPQTLAPGFVRVYWDGNFYGGNELAGWGYGYGRPDEQYACHDIAVREIKHIEPHGDGQHACMVLRDAEFMPAKIRVFGTTDEIMAVIRAALKEPT